jgi:hypothetical protein
MAHYAYIEKETNIVVAVTVGKDEAELIDGLDTETYYAQGTPYTVKRTSYNAATNGFRKNYAGVGYTYDEARDAFIAPKPYDSWVLDEETCQWQAPTPYPTDGLMYVWVEDDLNWQAFNFPTE